MKGSGTCSNRDTINLESVNESKASSLKLTKGRTISIINGSEIAFYRLEQTIEPKKWYFDVEGAEEYQKAVKIVNKKYRKCFDKHKYLTRKEAFQKLCWIIKESKLKIDTPPEKFRTFNTYHLADNFRYGVMKRGEDQWKIRISHFSEVAKESPFLAKNYFNGEQISNMDFSTRGEALNYLEYILKLEKTL